MKILTVFGTRPEAIKMAPLLKKLQSNSAFTSVVCVTAQHREMLDQVLDIFDVRPDLDLNIMRAGQGLPYITSTVISEVSKAIASIKPDRMLVHGDTTTTMASALAGFYAGVPVGHVEAGLRTGNIKSPWPEELNRRMTGMTADLHFAPTPASRDNLLREGVRSEAIEVTGNTVIDSMLLAVARIEGNPSVRARLETAMPFLAKAKAEGRRIILATGHRRENLDGGLAAVFSALSKLATRPDVSIVLPVHLNPRVRTEANAILGARTNVHLIEPQDYLAFVHLMAQAYLIVTDSGGVQEEAPSLGKPVLVTRDTTERPEAVEAGTVKLVGCDEVEIVAQATRLLDDGASYERMSKAHNPYGDGQASDRIVSRLMNEIY